MYRLYTIYEGVAFDLAKTFANTRGANELPVNDPISFLLWNWPQKKKQPNTKPLTNQL